MRLTTADQLALMLTSAGSQRKLAAYLGVSHQKIGRWLKGERVDDQGVIHNIPKAIDEALLHKGFRAFQKASGKRADEVPYYVERLPLTYGPRAGQPGLRSVIRHTDTLSDEAFDAMILDLLEDGDYYEIMVESEVDLKEYFQRGEEHMRDRLRTEAQRDHRKNLADKLDRGLTTARIFTKRHAADPRIVEPERVVRTLHKMLREKHEPAATRPGTRTRTSVLLSIKPDRGQPKPPAKRKAAKKTRKP